MGLLFLTYALFLGKGEPDLDTDIIPIAKYYPFIKSENVHYQNLSKVVTTRHDSDTGEDKIEIIRKGVANQVKLSREKFNKFGDAGYFSDVYLTTYKSNKYDTINVKVWGKNRDNYFYSHYRLVDIDFYAFKTKPKIKTISRKVKSFKYNPIRKEVIIAYEDARDSMPWCFFVWGTVIVTAIVIPVWIKGAK